MRGLEPRKIYTEADKEILEVGLESMLNNLYSLTDKIKAEKDFNADTLEYFQTLADEMQHLTFQISERVALLLTVQPQDECVLPELNFE